MYGKMKEFLTKELDGIKAAGLYKNERIITTPQRAGIKVGDGQEVLNFCANNYLGLSDNTRLAEVRRKHEGKRLRNVVSKIHLRNTRHAQRA